MYFDTHCHLNYETFKDNWREVAKRANDANVSKINNIGTDISTWDSAISLSEEMPENFIATLGVHPIHVHEPGYEDSDQVLTLLAAKMKHKNVKAVGEAGLDYKHHPETAELQKEYFKRFIDFAKQHDKTLVMHCRDAYQDFYEILKKNLSKDQRGVVHFYIGDLEMMKKLLDLGLYIGFTGVITYPKTENYAENIKAVPADRFVIETDSPFAAPVPYRGRQNEPAYVIEVARRIAEIRGLTLSEAAEVSSKNANDLFDL